MSYHYNDCHHVWHRPSGHCHIALAGVHRVLLSLGLPTHPLFDHVAELFNSLWHETAKLPRVFTVVKAIDPIVDHIGV